MHAIGVGESSTSTDVIQELLLSLPGITIHNFRILLDNVENMAQLSKLKLSEFTKLLGHSIGKKLFDFFQQRG